MAERTISVKLQLKLSEWQSGWTRATQTVKSSTEDLSRSVKKNKAELDGMAKGFATVGLVAGAGLAIAVKKFADFDKAMSNVKAATHETAGNMQLLRDAAIDAGAKTAFSATEAASAIENLAKAGVTTKDILGGGLKGALDLAAAGSLGVGQAAEIAATAMAQFKLSGKDVPHIADLLAAGAGKAQGEVSDLAAALNQSGLVASQFGLSVEETTGTLAAFASAGLLGSDAGTSFKTMLLRLANPADEAVATMEDLGIKVHDAQGEFIGIAPLAEQLRKHLGNLTAEQRDAALATIFGSDAIRAANVLYNNGAKGIVDWTNKVNDAGFAAETAAIKQDNLRGDLEKLSGAFETLLIKIGQGGNGPFRGLVKGTTDLVDKLGDLPPAAQQATLAVAAITAVSGLAAGGTLKAVTAANNLKTSWQSLGRAGKALTLSAGAIGIALGAAAVIYGAFSKRNEEAKRRASELRDTLDQQTGALTGNTRAYVSNELATKGLSQAAKDLGLSLPDVTEAALGSGRALDEVVGSLDAIIKAGTTVTNTGKSGLITTFSEQAQSARALKDNILGLNSNLTDAQRTQRLAAEGAETHKSSQQTLAEAVAKSNQKVREEVQSLDELIEAMHRASGAALTLSGSQIAYQAALDDAVQSLKDNGKTLDINTEKGRANQSALNSLAKAANDQTDAMLKSGRSNTVVAKTAEDARANISKVAHAMGLSKPKADALARSYIDIPKVVKTAVSAPGATKAKREVDSHATSLRNLPKDKKTSIGTKGIPKAKTDIKDFATYVDRQLGLIPDEAVRVSLFTSKAPGGRVPVERATGGPVWGAGSATSDSIPARLSNGEHVITAREVQGAGGHGAVAAMRASWAQGFAGGGAVLRSDPQSKAGVHSVASAVAQELGDEIRRRRAAAGINPNLNGVLDFARAQTGEPYVWGGAGPNGWDCSGFMSALVNVAQGRSPYQRRFATGSLPAGLFEPGFGAFSIGWVNGNPGHTAGTVNGVNVESRGGAGVVVGAGARGSRDGLFNGPWHLKGFAKGGPVGDPPFDLLDPRGKLGGKDNVLIRATTGEFVVNKDSTARHRGLLEMINRAPGFANGGPVGQLGSSPLPGLAASFRALMKSLERNTKAVSTTADRIRSLVEQRNAFAAATTSSFTGGLFDQGSSASDLNLRLQARKNDARGLQKSLSTLKKKGLNAGLWKELSASSNYQAAAELAAMTPAQIKAINASYLASNKATAALGAYAGNTAFGAQISSQQDLLRRQQANVKTIRQAMDGLKVKIIKQGGSSYLQAISGS